MREATFDGHLGRKVAIDLCAGCNGIWFDGMESHQLTPGATLALFKQMGEAVAEANRPLGARKACPRCQAPLTREIDKQRSTTFEAFRCPAGHGRYMTFGAFLRAKNFVRDLTPVEVAELRRHVQSVKCTGCGAAVDVREHSACTFCRAPIAMIDPDQLQRTIAALQDREAMRPKPRGGQEPAPGRPDAAAAPRPGAAPDRAGLRRPGGAQPVDGLHRRRIVGPGRRRAVVDRVDPRESRRRVLTCRRSPSAAATWCASTRARRSGSAA